MIRLILQTLSITGGAKMKTIKLTDDQFETLFEFVDQKVESIVNTSVDYQDSEILEEWEDLFDVHTVLETVDNWS